MSFSSKVKEELYQVSGSARHCQLAELAAILHYLCRENEDGAFYIHTDNEDLLDKCYGLMLKLFHSKTEGTEKPSFSQLCNENVLKTLKLVDSEGHLVTGDMAIDGILIKNACCKRAFLRGVFLCSGSVSNPEKGYHLEFVLTGDHFAKQLCQVIQTFDVEARITKRKKYTIVYVKEGEGIVDLLNVMGAFSSLMDLENLRILKEISNSINRQVNCEAANINKTVQAATKQVDDILKIREYYGFERLPKPLLDMAQVRLENPEAALKELGELMDPPIGKSGVNHRLRKLSEIAAGLPDL